MFPDKPANSSITALFEKLTAHFKPNRLKIAERYKFWKNKQGASQPLADYISEIRKLASTCQFLQEYLQDALTAAFVLGLRDENISRKLLAEKNLTLDKAIATAQSLQIGDKEAREMALQPTARVDGINAHKRVNKWPGQESSVPHHQFPARLVDLKNTSTGIQNVLIKPLLVQCIIAWSSCKSV